MSRGSFGKVGLVCLLNPMHVVAVPSYNKNKLRCCEYLPIGILEWEDNKIVEVDTTVFENDYTAYTVNELSELLKNNPGAEHDKFIFRSLDDLIGTTFETLSKDIEERTTIVRDKNIYHEDDGESFDDNNDDYVDFYDEEE